MQLTTFAQQFTGKTFDELFVSAKLVRFAEKEIGSNTYTVEVWDDSLGKPPTDAQIAKALATPEPAPVPASVTRAQAKIALFRTGHLDAVKVLVQEAGGEVQLWFDEATTWERQNPNVLALGGPNGLKLTDAEIDDLFVLAAQIQA